MTVLRSREVLSTVISKAPHPPEKGNAVLEPVTPSKSIEFINQSSSTTTPSSSFTAEKCRELETGLGFGHGSVMVVESGSQRRCSARLASKVGMNRYLGSVGIVSGRKKRKVEGSALDGEFDSRNLEGGKGWDLNVGLEMSGDIHEMSLNGGNLPDLDDRDFTELATEREGVGEGGSVAKLELDCDAKSLSLETLDNGRPKRKLSMEVKSLGFELHEQDEVGKGFLSLRSGKKVIKGELRDHSGAGNRKENIENKNTISALLSRDDPFETSPQASMKEFENGHLLDSGFSTGEKGKGKISCETVMSGSFSVNFELDDSYSNAINLPKSTDSRVIIKEKGSVIIETGVKTRGRMSKEEKGKMKLGARDSSSRGHSIADSKGKNKDGSSSSRTSQSAALEPLQDRVQERETNVVAFDARRTYRERFRRIARQLASQFAHFSSPQELENHSPDGGDSPLPKTDDDKESWPGPFSTAMKIYKDRVINKHEERRGSSSDKSEAVELKWVPKKQETGNQQKQAPSLQELCLLILSKNADAVSSLDFVPDVLRHKICWFLCDSCRMNGHFLKLLVQGSPTELRIKNCSWLSEEVFTKTFEGCDFSKLTVLQIDLCGNSMPDYTLHDTLARSPNNLPALTTISLKGAYRLTDTGLSLLASSAPSLKSINISQCPLLTAEGIYHLAKPLRSILRELYLDECQAIDAMLMLPVLLNLENLEVLSVRGIQTVCDDFVITLISAHGCRMKELGLADCTELTDVCTRVIGEFCSELCAIDLTNLPKLTDVSIAHLANGCQQIQMLKLGRSRFSDEAIAAYLDLRGAFLKDLSLNNVIQVSNHTALSLARNCRNLRSLDVSWCRKLTNEALGLIVDSCLLLESLKLFGCTRVTKVFLDGHSNPHVKIIGMKMTPVLKHIDVPDFLVGPLRYSWSSP